MPNWPPIGTAMQRLMPLSSNRSAIKALPLGTVVWIKHISTNERAATLLTAAGEEVMLGNYVPSRWKVLGDDL